jgi:polysaccharide export outer membrane protein
MIGILTGTQHRDFTTPATGSPAMQRSLLQSTRCIALLALFCLAGVTARAQFNGPPTTSVPENYNAPAIPTTDPLLLFPPVHNATLRSGDLVTIRVYGSEDFNPVVRIDRDGYVRLPLVGSIHFGGLSVPQAESILAEQLELKGIFVDPQITLQVTDGPDQSITVMGETHGIVPALGDRKLLDVLSFSGGIPITTSHVVTIDRPGLAEPLVVDLGNDPAHSAMSNIPLFAGDVVITSRVGVVYVVGAFKSAGVIPMNSYGPLTLTQLSALSGGPTFAAKNGDLHIIRTVGNHRTVTTLDIKKVINGKVPDPILQPNDIVYLPNSAIKQFFVGGTLSTLLGFLSLGISLETLGR